mgnify:CR=1 FL=1
MSEKRLKGGRRLRRMAEQIVAAATIAPDAEIPAGRNRTGRSLLLPGVNTDRQSAYPAFWTRDPAWIAEGGLVNADDVWGWATLLLETMRGDAPWHLPSGSVVLPYSIADHVNLDGTPVYYPGTYASDESQGNLRFGKYPPHDDQYWPTFTTYAYVRLAHDAFPVDVDTGLCVTDVGAATYRSQAQRIRQSIPAVFAHRDADGALWLRSATGIGSKPDVWGTAYAVYSGAVGAGVARELAASLLSGYRRGTTVQDGQVRHIPADHGYWERAAERGVYQNGGYWGYPVGWYVYALSLVDFDAAGDLFREYLRAVTSCWEEGFAHCAWECVNSEIGHAQNPGYAATVALPYVCLKEKGLL